MASFKALNAESDDELDDEQDNTKEIQVEETLRVYQNAVKAQAQGPPALEETRAAYAELFESEIFKYPESLSEYRREEAYGESAQDGELVLDEPQYEAIEGVETASSILPQVLHLAYKNRGQFHLDTLREVLKSKRTDDEEDSEEVKKHALDALNDLAEALDKDADDVDVWRRAARVGRMLGSRRTARFCLEAVVDGDELGMDDLIGDAGVDIKLADHDLQDLKKELDDGSSEAPRVAKSQKLPGLWRKQLALYTDMPDLSPSTPSTEPEETLIECDRSWLSIGDALLQRLLDALQGSMVLSPGSYVRIFAPQVASTPRANSIITGSTPRTSKSKSPELLRRKSSVPYNRRDTISSIDPEALLSPPPETPLSQQTMTLPSRKRSSETAELPENADGGRVRSKRIRARESLAADPRESDLKTVETPAYESRIKECSQADEWLYELLNILTMRAGLREKRSMRPYRSLVREQQSFGLGESSRLPLGQAVLDFYNMMQSWDADKSNAMLRDARDVSAGDSHNTLQAFLEHSNSPRRKRQEMSLTDNITPFIDEINHERLSLVDVAGRWLSRMCETYVKSLWPANLKQAVLDIAVTIDHTLFMRQDLSLLNLKPPEHLSSSLDLDFVQTLYELHLDLYASMSGPSSVVDDDIRVDQKARLNRWGCIAREVVCRRFQNGRNASSGEDQPALLTRHIWASVFHMQASAEVSQEYLMACFAQLKSDGQAIKGPGITLPNSDLMPELRSTAVDREISKLETMGFFQSIFQDVDKPPVDLIQSLEPLMERTVGNRGSPESGRQSASRTATPSHEVDGEGTDQVHRSRSPLDVLSEFLNKATPSLRLMLWMRLRDAYRAIHYPAKMVSIHLRCIQTIMDGLKSEEFKSKSDEARRAFLLETIRDLREILTDLWNLVKSKDGPSMFECFDLGHVQDSIQAILDLSTFLYAVFMFDDYSQIGDRGGPTVNPFRKYPSDTFHTPSIKLHDMQVQAFIILYRLFGEVMEQAPQYFPAAAEDKLQYLRYIHYDFGTRKICKALESSFLHFLKTEYMTNFPGLEIQSSSELAQVLYDLYDIQCFSTSTDRQDHGCDEDYLDHSNAMQLVDFVLDKAKVANTKDLLKTDLGKAVEKLHSTLDWVLKSTLAARRNGRLYTTFFKSPIFPISIFRALRGLVDVPAIPVKEEDALIASKGWFFLKGQLALARYRAVRQRNQQGDEEDLHQANRFFHQDIENSPERWETWYRMAQAFELLVEEQTMWKSDHVNTNPEEVAGTQKSAIHAYTMAVAMSAQNAEPTPENRAKLSELYTDFGVCLYSASRQPFSMKAFTHEGHPQKHFWDEDSEGYEGRLYHPMSEGEVWKVAAVLLRQAAALNPSSWMNYHMLAKCHWKLHQRSDGRQSSRKALQKSLSRAVRLCPRRKDQARQDPVLEPIYKIVSITHKLVSSRRELTQQAGAAFIEKHLDMQNQFDASKRPLLSESSSWDAYVLDLLKMLRTADKSRWHHRFVIRAARLMQEEGVSQREGATVAKEYLADQHIYSAKTMTLSVWKPDNERPGRHHVYNTRYCIYLNSLLDRTSDLDGIQNLAKRVRKKPGEFFEHVRLWALVMNTHLKLHQAHANVTQGCSEFVFKDVDQDQFKPMAARIDGWTKKPANGRQAPFCEVLKELVELKRLNNNLIKPNAIDDVIADTFAEIWIYKGEDQEPHVEVEAVPALAAEAVSQGPAEGPPVASPQPVAAPSTPPKGEKPNIMSFQSLLNMDGTAERSPLARPDTSTPRQTAVETPQHQNDTNLTPTKARPRLISKREILKRATDSVLIKQQAKAVTPPRNDVGPKQLADNTPTRVGPSQTGEDGSMRAASSAPASVHDSADDESELSSVGDQIDEGAAPPKPMFPGLAKKNSNVAPSGRASDGDDDDDEEKDEDHTREAGAATSNGTAVQEDRMEVD